MSDIASLSIKIDSREINQGITNLKRLEQQAKATEVAVDGLYSKKISSKVLDFNKSIESSVSKSTLFKNATKQLSAELNANSSTLEKAHLSAEKVSTSQAKASTATKNMTASMKALFREIDPVAAKTMEVNQATKAWEVQLKQGTITAGQFAAIQGRLSASLLQTTKAANDSTVAQVKMSASMQSLLRRADPLGSKLAETKAAMKAWDMQLKQGTITAKQHSAVLKVLHADLAKVQAGAMPIAKTMSNNAKATHGFTSAMKGLLQVMAAFAVIDVVRQLININDVSTEVVNKLKVVTSTQQELNKTFEDLSDVARNSWSDIDTSTTLFQRMKIATDNLGTSNQDLLRVTELINKSFVLSGASVQEAQGAIRQLTQAFNSNMLRGEEFNSVTEQAPIIMKALEKQTGLTGMALRKLAEEGGISAKVMLDAFNNFGGEIDRLFDKTEKTFSVRLVEIRNEFIEWSKETKSVSSASMALADVLDVLGDALRATIDTTSVVIGLFTDSLERFGSWTKVVGDATGATKFFNNALLSMKVAFEELKDEDSFFGSMARMIERADEKLQKMANNATASEKQIGLALNRRLEIMFEIDKIQSDMADTPSLSFQDASTEKIEALNKELSALDRVIKGLSKSDEEVAESFKVSTKALGEMGEAAAKVATQMSAFKVAEAKSIEQSEHRRRITKSIIADIATENDALKKGTKAEMELKAAREAANRASTRNNELKKLGIQLTEADISEIEKAVLAQMQLEDSIEKANKAKEKALKLALSNAEAMQKERESLEDFINELRGMDEATKRAKEYSDQLGKLSEAKLKGVITGDEFVILEEKIRDVRDQIPSLAEVSEQTAGKMGDAFGDVFEMLGDKLGGLGGTLGEFGKGFGKDLFGSLQGVFGKGGTGISGLLSGDLSGLKGMFGNIAGGLGNIFSGKGGIMESITGMFSGAGGAGLGNLLGGLGQAAGSALGNIGGGRFGDIGASLGGLAGNLLPIPILGPALGSALGGLIGGFIGPKPTDSTQISRLDLGTGRTRDTGSLTGEKFSQENRTAADTSTALLNQVAQSLGGITGGELSFIVGNRDGIRVEFDGEELFKTKGDVNAALDFATEKLFELSGKTSEVYKALALEGETLGAAYLRLEAEFDAVDKVAEALGITFDLTGEAGLKAADQLVMVSGGLDAFVSKSQFFADAFTTATEKWQSFTNDLVQGFDEVGVAIPATRAAFAALVQSQDLTTEAGQRLAAELLNIAPAADLFYQHQEALIGKQIELLGAEGKGYEATIRSREQVLKGMDSETAAIQEQIFAAEDKAVVDNLNLELLRLTGNATQALTIEREAMLAGLSEEQALIQQEIFAKQDENKLRELNIRLLRAQGKEEQALKLTRESQLAGLTEAEAAIMKLIFAEEDLSKRRQRSATETAAIPTDNTSNEFNAIFERQVADMRDAFLQQLEAGMSSETLLELSDNTHVSTKAMEQALEQFNNTVGAASETLIDTRKLQVELLQEQGKAAEALALQRELALEGKAEEEQTIMRQIFAQQDLNAQREKLLAIDDLNIELLREQGMAEEALVMIRQRQLESLSEAEAAIMSQIFAQQDLNTERDRETQRMNIVAGFSQQLTRMDFTALESQLFDLDQQIQSAIDEVMRLGGSEQDLSTIREFGAKQTEALMKAEEDRLKAIEDQRKSQLDNLLRSAYVELIKGDMTELDAALFSLQQQFLEQIDTAKELGATEQQLDVFRKLEDQQRQKLIDEARLLAETEAAEALSKITDELNKLASTAFDNLKRSVDAEKDALKRNFESDVESINSRYQSITDNLNGALESTTERVSKLSNIAGQLKSAVEETAKPLTLAERKAASNRLLSVFDQVKAGADISTFDLSADISKVTQPSNELFGSFADFAFEQAVTRVNLKNLSDEAEKQLTNAEQQVMLLEQQLEQTKIQWERDLEIRQEMFDAENARLDLMLTNAQEQLDALNGIDNSVQSLGSALSGFASSVRNAQAAQAAASRGISAEVIQAATAGGAFAPDLLNPRGPRVEGTASFTLPGFATGTDNTPEGSYIVGENGPEVLNIPGAGVMSNEDMRELMDNREVLEAIRQAIQRGNFELIKYTKRSYDVLDDWDTNGLPKERV